METVDGVEALRDAAASVGLDVVPADHAGADLILLNPSGGRLPVYVKRTALVSADGLARRLREWRSARSREPGIAGVVVSDRVTAEARELLRKDGWGWLDLRGHLHVSGLGMFVDTELPALKKGTSRPTEPLTGRVGLGVAARLLLEPTEPVAVRRLARELDRAPSSVSQAVSSLRQAGLLDERGRPETPALFWEVAGRWRSQTADLAALPSPGLVTVNEALRLNLDDIEQESGWALGDTLAAVAYGASIGVRTDHPPDLYVPDDTTMRRAVKLLGRADDYGARAATVRVALLPDVCARRVDAAGWTTQPWPLTQPLFVALDLAQDPGRGREMLDAWTPPEPWHRVW